MYYYINCYNAVGLQITAVEISTISLGASLPFLSTEHDKKNYEKFWFWGANKHTLTTFTRDYAFSFSVPSLVCLSHPPTQFWNHMQVLWYSLSTWTPASLLSIHCTH